MSDSFTIPDPAGTGWNEWAETLVGFNPRFKNQLWPEMEWKRFGARLSLIEPRAPRPEFFKDWREWAGALKMSLAR